MKIEDTVHENFIRAFKFLEETYVITSNISGRRFKKTNGDYYWCKDMQSCNRGEWHICKVNEGLFTSGEIQGDWTI